jgi:hypothetical protein
MNCTQRYTDDGAPILEVKIYHQYQAFFADGEPFNVPLLVGFSPVRPRPKPLLTNLTNKAS